MATNHGCTFLTEIIDKRGRETPDRTFMSVARTANLKDGFDDLSYGCFVQAVDRCAFWLESNVRKQGDQTTPDSKVIFASLPRHDLRCLLLIFAAHKIGCQVRGKHVQKLV